MHLAIRYTTRFDYPERVRQSHNELRAAPTTSDTQFLLSYRVASEPVARVFSYVDYFGTLVDAFGVRQYHEDLTVTVEATVETSAAPPVTTDAPLEHRAEPSFVDLAWEYLQPSVHAALTDRVRAEAGPKMAAAEGCLELLDALTEHAHGLLAYRSGSTRIGENLDVILDRGAGVCQDYAHLLVAMCRVVGLPARYVSGYLYALDSGVEGLDPEQAGAGHGPVRVQTHAWVETLLPGIGWVPRDPTNLQPVGERHVKIGAGRDYDDVTPLKGVYAGGGQPVLAAEVEMRQLVELDRLAALRERANQQQQQQ